MTTSTSLRLEVREYDDPLVTGLIDVLQQDFVVRYGGPDAAVVDPAQFRPPEGLFLVGFGCGAVFAGPVSETVGRNPVYIGTLALYMLFVLAAALAPGFGAWAAFRFVAGVFGYYFGARSTAPAGSLPGGSAMRTLVS